MNSLWGAGQMMFNKILAVLPEETDIHDYRIVAKVISQNVDPVQDIQFVKGPVDILDHSSSKFALGSKMGIDATRKLGEENQVAASAVVRPEIRIDKIKKDFPEIIEINGSLVENGISLVILSVKKERRGQIHDVGNRLIEEGFIRDIKFILFMDIEVGVSNYPDIAWLAANNIDPLRDCFIVADEGKPFSSLLIDATRKSARLDGFKRDWPNVIVMDDSTIFKVDNNWTKYGLGPFIASPSKRYKPLIVNNGSMVNPGE
jgi:4-hydroxy-3-polyprenylbenzoate decarboxylase